MANESAGGVDAAAWDALATHAAQPNPFLERFAAEPFFGLGRGAPRPVAVRAGGEAVGLAMLTEARGYARLPLRHVTSWCHPHLFDATPLVRRGAEAAFAHGLLDWLGARDGARFAHLTQLREGPVAAAIRAAAGERGLRAETVHTAARPFLDLTGYAGFEDYLARAVSPRTRKSVRRLRRRLAERGVVTLATLAPGEDAGPWLDAFFAAEHAGWKGAMASSLTANPGERAAFASMATTAHARGRLIASQLRVDGQPVAHALDLRAGGGAFALKTAFDPAWSDASPGVLLEAALIERGLRDARAGGPVWIDSCAAEGHDVLSRLWPETRPLIQLLVERPGAAASAAYTVVRGLERMSERRRRA